MCAVNPPRKPLRRPWQDKFVGNEFGRRSRPRRGELQGKGSQLGEARTLSEVAEREGMDRADVSRMVDLTTLAPVIVAAILDETRSPEVTLVDSHVGDAAVVGGAAGKT